VAQLATRPAPFDRLLRLATRGSPLARRQADLVAALLVALHPDLCVELVVVRTRGDRQTEVPLDRIGGQGVFTKEVQAAVMDGRADVAVHSAKDLPSVTPDGLVLAAVPPRADARDALVGRPLGELPAGAAVATGSARRRAQLANIRPDLCFVELRGNMDTRVRRGEDGSVDAVVVAVAALDRLGWSDRITEVLPVSVMLPQAGQGALALECRADDVSTMALLAALDDALCHQALSAERAMLAGVGGSCAVPVGAWAEPAAGGGLRLQGMVASGDGRILVRAELCGRDPEVLGRELALHLMEDCGGSSIEGWELTGLFPAASHGSGRIGRPTVAGTAGALHPGATLERPLAGTTVAVTRAREQAGPLATVLSAAGARVVEVPVIEIAEPEDSGASLLQAAVDVADYDWIAFTSANAVHRFVPLLRDGRAFGGARLAAVGPGTAAALAAYHLVADLLPAGGDEVGAAGLASGFPEAPVGGRVLFPRAAGARRSLPDGLRAKGWEVDEVVAYRTVAAPAPPVEIVAALAEADVVTFASPSAVTAYLSMRTGAGSPLPVPPVIACIGPATAAAARRALLGTIVESPTPSPEALEAAIAAHFAHRS